MGTSEYCSQRKVCSQRIAVVHSGVVGAGRPGAASMAPTTSSGRGAVVIRHTGVRRHAAWSWDSSTRKA